MLGGKGSLAQMARAFDPEVVAIINSTFSAVPTSASQIAMMQSHSGSLGASSNSPSQENATKRG
jgi:hypothetical protein